MQNGAPNFSILTAGKYIMLLCLSGAEGVRVVFRSNMGRSRIKLSRVIICSLFLFLWGFMCIDMANTHNHRVWEMTGAITTGIVLAAISIFILVKGVRLKRKALNGMQQPDFEGESIFFGFLADYGWSEKLIHLLAEPLYVLIIGSFLYFCDPFLFAIALLASLSVWLEAFAQMFQQDMSSLPIESNKAFAHNQGGVSYQVSSDEDMPVSNKKNNLAPQNPKKKGSVLLFLLPILLVAILATIEVSTKHMYEQRQMIEATKTASSTLAPASVDAKNEKTAIIQQPIDTLKKVDISQVFPKRYPPQYVTTNKIAYFYTEPGGISRANFINENTKVYHTAQKNGYCFCTYIDGSRADSGWILMGDLDEIKIVFDHSFSLDKTVISLNEKITVSDDGEKIADGKAIRKISDIKEIDVKSMPTGAFFEKLAALLERENNFALKQDFTGYLKYDRYKHKRIFVLDIDKIVITNEVTAAIIHMLRAAPNSEKIPPAAVRYIKNPFQASLVDLDKLDSE